MKSVRLSFAVITLLTLVMACSHQYQVSSAEQYDVAEGDTAQIAENEAAQSAVSEELVAANTATENTDLTDNKATVEANEANANAFDVKAPEVSEVGNEATSVTPATNENATKSTKGKTSPKRSKSLKRRVGVDGISGAIAVLNSPEDLLLKELAGQDPLLEKAHAEPQLASPELSPLRAIQNHLFISFVGGAIVFAWFFVAWRKRKNTGYDGH